MKYNPLVVISDTQGNFSRSSEIFNNQKSFALPMVNLSGKNVSIKLSFSDPRLRFNRDLPNSWKIGTCPADGETQSITVLD
jgi:hypothetical protein